MELTCLTSGRDLRDAQLAMLKDPSRFHPYYWAVFVVIGDGSNSIQERGTWNRVEGLNWPIIPKQTKTRELLEMIVLMAKSVDKEFIVIEGASHGGTPCTECEKFPGQYSNTVQNLFDHVQAWINARY